MSKVNKFKVVFAGDQNVGKTSIISRFIFDNYDDTPNPTVGIDFLTKTIQIDNQTVRLQLWDTAGQQRFRSLIPSYIKDSDACVIIYDITSIITFENISKWIDFVKQTRGQEALIFLVGNKIDSQQREVKTTQAENFSKMNQISFCQVSAKTGHNIQNLFRSIVNKLQQKIHKENQIQVQITQKDQKYTKAINISQNKNSKQQQNQSGRCTC